MQIVQGDSLVKELVSVYAVSDLTFETTQDYLKLYAAQDRRVGLVFAQAETANPRLGGNLILTCDLDAKQVIFVQLLHGVSQHHAADLQSIVLDARDPLEPVYVSPRSRGEDYVPQMVRPRVEFDWSFARENVAPLDPREFVEVGWPPDLPDLPYWHFMGCDATAWVDTKGVLTLRAAQVSERLAGNPENSRSLVLDYVIRVPDEMPAPAENSDLKTA